MKFEEMLMAIKKECDSNEDCCDCPFRSHDLTVCMINSSIPGDWKLANHQPPKRVFK